MKAARDDFPCVKAAGDETPCEFGSSNIACLTAVGMILPAKL